MTTVIFRFAAERILEDSVEFTEAQMMLTNPRDAFKGHQSRLL